MLLRACCQGPRSGLRKFRAKTQRRKERHQAYQRVLRSVTAPSGKATRRLIYEAFPRFFNGTAQTLDWADTVRQISI